MRKFTQKSTLFLPAFNQFLRILLTVCGLFITSLGTAMASNMILEFDTNLADGTTVQLPLSGNVNIQVNWGDGSAIESFNTAGLYTHTYNNEGTYTVQLLGTLEWYGSSDAAYKPLMLKKVLSFGGLNIQSLESAFNGAKFLIEVPSTLPSSVTSLKGTFALATLFNGDISNWDVSNVTNMSGMFASAASFNQNIANWNVSRVTDMSYMFSKTNVFNQDIGNWDVSNVTNMSYMFYGSRQFNQDIGSWNVSQVINMSYMFSIAKVFNQDIGNWNVSNVVNMSNMFTDATAFNNPIGSWDVSKVTNMSNMFYAATSFNQNINSWNTGNVINMNSMFYGASSFNNTIANWNVSQVTNMAYMFFGARVFNQPLNNWDVSALTNVAYMFYGAQNFNQPLDNWNVSNVTNMRGMFNGASAFNQSLSSWNVSSVTDMTSLFSAASSFDQNLANWNVGNVSSMNAMFQSAKLSTVNYDALLRSWSQKTLKYSVTFDGGSSQYSAAALRSRDSLINNYNWVITDGGPIPAPVVTSVTVPASGSYRAGHNLDFTVNFDQVVYVSGVPYIEVGLQSGGTAAAYYISGSGSSSLTFRYTVDFGHQDIDGIDLSPGIILGNTDAITNNMSAAQLDLNSVASTQGILIGVPARVYVNKNQNTGNIDGTTWANAYTDLQSALRVAVAGDEIWVAAGTYYPSSINNRYEMFNIADGVKLYGGFAGTESTLAERNPQVHKTTLSGDIGITGDLSDNSYTVVFMYQVSDATVLDGFTIADGNGAQHGAGLYNEVGSPVINQCIFTNNRSNGTSGALYNNALPGGSMSPTITNSVFVGNESYSGGAVRNEAGSGGTCSPVFINVIFYNNGAQVGSAIENRVSTGGTVSPTIINCTFFANRDSSPIANDTRDGGNDVDPVLLNTIFWQNTFYYNQEDPAFINADDPDGPDNSWMTEDDGLRLSNCSPAVNAGVNTNAPDLDILGNPVGYGIKDLGAYESTSEGAPDIAQIAGARNIFPNQTLQLTNASTGGVWRSQDTSVASISATGLLKGLSPGTVTIYYTLTNTFGCTDSVEVSLDVNFPPVLEKGETCAITELFLTGNNVNIDHILLYKDQVLIDTVYVDGKTVAGGNGYGNAPNQLSFPTSIAFDEMDNLYITDADNGRIQKWAPGATAGITVAGGNGNGNSANQFSNPGGIALDAVGNLYVADISNHRIQKWVPGATAGITVAGGNGPGNAANQLAIPTSVAVDAAGNLYVADYENHRIQKWAPGATAGVTVAGGNGQGNAANQFDYPYQITIDGAGNLFIADLVNQRIQKWAPGATAGVTVAGGNGPGNAANQILDPVSIAIDGAGNLYVAEYSNQRIQKWVPGASRGVMVAGGGGRPMLGIAFDSSSALYFSDAFENRVARWEGNFIASGPGTYKAEVHYADGSSYMTDTLTIDPVVPPVLAYPLTTLDVRKNVSISPIVPQLTPGSNPSISYSVSPALPLGLEIDPQTGIISGTLTASLSGSQTFAITASNCAGASTVNLRLSYNTAPTNISLNKSNLFEGNNVGALIGSLTSTDTDAGDSHSYSLVGGDVSAFSVSGNQLRAALVYNHDTKNSYTLTIRSTDSGGLSYDKVFTISISRKPGVFGTSTPVNRQSLPATITTPVISKGYSSNLKVVGDNLVSYSWSPATGLSSTNSANPVATPNQTTTYTVTVTNSFGSSTTVSITVTVEEDYNVTANNILTPDGDGVNDVWVVENITTYPQAEVKVFDKAGRPVFVKTNYANDWNASNLNRDTYYYVITFGPNIIFKKRGYITIVK